MASKGSRLKDHFSYLDMFVSAVVDHEKNLNSLILRLEETVEKISEVVEKVQRDQSGRGENSYVFKMVDAEGLPEKAREIHRSESVKRLK